MAMSTVLVSFLYVLVSSNLLFYLLGVETPVSSQDLSVRSLCEWHFSYEFNSVCTITSVL